MPHIWTNLTSPIGQFDSFRYKIQKKIKICFKVIVKSKGFIIKMSQSLSSSFVVVVLFYTNIETAFHRQQCSTSWKRTVEMCHYPLELTQYSTQYKKQKKNQLKCSVTTFFCFFFFDKNLRRQHSCRRKNRKMCHNWIEYGFQFT